VATIFESSAALGLWQTKLAADAAGQRFIQAVFGPSSPVTGIIQQTGRVLPL